MEIETFYTVYCSLASKMHCVPLSKNEFLTREETELPGAGFSFQIKRELKNLRNKWRFFVVVTHPEKMCRYSVSCDKIVFMELTPVAYSQKFLLTVYAKESTLSLLL